MKRNFLLMIILLLGVQSFAQGGKLKITVDSLTMVYADSSIEVHAYMLESKIYKEKIDLEGKCTFGILRAGDYTVEFKTPTKTFKILKVKVPVGRILFLEPDLTELPKKIKYQAYLKNYSKF